MPHDPVSHHSGKHNTADIGENCYDHGIFKYSGEIQPFPCLLVVDKRNLLWQSADIFRNLRVWLKGVQHYQVQRDDDDRHTDSQNE